MLELYEDDPVKFDAWDIDPSHFEMRTVCPPAERYEVIADGPLRAEVAFTRRVGERSHAAPGRAARRRRAPARAAHDGRLARGHKLLKVCFPLAVRAPSATYEMPFGYAERPTHFSTSIDRARYEVPGHRFADLSEHGFGAALLTDSQVRLQLLRERAADQPAARAEVPRSRGRHGCARVRIRALPARGRLARRRRPRRGGAFNAPLRWTPAGRRVVRALDATNLVLDTITRGERSGALLLRLVRGARRARLGG